MAPKNDTVRHKETCVFCGKRIGIGLSHNDANHVHGSLTLNGEGTWFFVSCNACSIDVQMFDWGTLAKRGKWL